jgi:putative transposase
LAKLDTSRREFLVNNSFAGGLDHEAQTFSGGTNRVRLEAAELSMAAGDIVRQLGISE